MRFVRIFWNNNVPEAYLPKMSLSGQIVFKIVAQLCLENSIQTLLIFLGSTPPPTKKTERPLWKVWTQGSFQKVGWVWSVPMNVVLNRETIVINCQTAGLFRVVLLVFWKPFSRFEIRISLPRSSLPADVLWSENSSTTRSNLFFKIAWHLHCEQTSNPPGRFHDNFSGHPLTTDSVSHAGKELKTLPRFMFYVPKVDDVLLQTQGSLWNLLRFLSKHLWKWITISVCPLWSPHKT